MIDEVSVSEAYRALHEHNRQAKADRRETAKADFAEAAAIAKLSGLEMYQYGDTHYRLLLSRAWQFDIYPGKCRLIGTKGSPFLKLPREWVLIDVVHAAVDAIKAKS